MHVSPDRRDLGAWRRARRSQGHASQRCARDGSAWRPDLGFRVVAAPMAKGGICVTGDHGPARQRPTHTYLS